MDKNIKYLVNNNRNDKEMLEKGQYNFRDHSPDEVSAAIDLVNPPRKVRVDRKDLVIDLPPRTESLTFNAAVLIPMKQRKNSRKDKCTSNGGKSKQKYIKGAVGKAQDTGVVAIKTRYTSKGTIHLPYWLLCGKSKGLTVMQCTGLQGEKARSMCSILGQDTLFPQCLYPPRSINRYQRVVKETR